MRNSSGGGSGDYAPTSDLEITELPDGAVGQEARKPGTIFLGARLASSVGGAGSHC